MNDYPDPVNPMTTKEVVDGICNDITVEQESDGSFIPVDLSSLYETIGKQGGTQETDANESFQSPEEYLEHLRATFAADPRLLEFPVAPEELDLSQVEGLNATKRERLALLKSDPRSLRSGRSNTLRVGRFGI